MSLASFFGRSGTALPSLLDAKAVRMVTSGRIAIGLALREMRVGRGDTVLVPAYHSPSMIPPVHWCGANVVFYRVHPDTTIDLDDIRSKIDGRVKAVIATHFFGFPQDLGGLRALCDAHGIGLLEDCAHAFFGHHGGTPVGAMGDYAIGSSMKFYPIYEGGCLVSQRHRLDLPLRSAGAGFEAKAALAALETSFSQGRLRGLKAMLALPLRAKDALWGALKARQPAGSAAPTLTPDSSDSSFDFDAGWIDKRSSLFSRLTLRYASRARIVARRRRHYRQLEQALQGIPGCRPLFPGLADGACPWVFPVLAERADEVGELLRAAGVHMVRFGATLWPGVDAGTCANSVALGRHLIGLPCHQELLPSELECLCRRIRQAFAAAAPLAA